MSSDVWAIRWKDAESRGYTDLLPESLFAREGCRDDVIHDVVGPQGEPYRARCRIDVRKQTVDLNYEAFPEFNEWYGMYLGILRLHFTNSQRNELSCTEWKHKGRKTFSEGKADISKDSLPAIRAYKRKKDAAKRRQQKIKERLGQVRFRTKLLRAYGFKCCVTGCPVVAALEGAHIDPHCGASSDHPQNGLLLRHDLHALFDKGLMAIDPETRRVRFALPALDWPEYRHLHASARLAPPTNGGPSYEPSEAALRRRWLQFKSIAKSVR